MPIAIKGKGVIDPPFKSGAYMKEDRQSPNCMLRFYEPTYHLWERPLMMSDIRVGSRVQDSPPN